MGWWRHLFGMSSGKSPIRMGAPGAARGARTVGEPGLSAPPGSAFSHLKPHNGLGAFFVLLCAGLTSLALFLSGSELLLLWLAGQVLLSFALMQWFALLHEAGHNTLFRTRLFNRLTGHVAGFFTFLPFGCWKLVHGAHHHWTGWHDLDRTNSALIPRRLGYVEKAGVNLCWRLCLPVFSVLYRLNHFWNLPHLWRNFPHRRQRRQMVASTLGLVIAYAAALALVGPLPLLRLVGLGLLLCLVMQEPLLLSQHTHIPLQLSHGEAVRPFPPLEQEVFTRSLRFPNWFSTFVLLHFDAHELHHMYSRVPGYYLRRIDYQPQNEVIWWRWLIRVKCLPGHVFLFQNRTISGLDI
jgi:omega-6 fatty acid desaturase (delta-12 desaturase)